MALSNFYTTAAGRDLLARAVTGTGITITRGQIGEGVWPEGTVFDTIGALVKPLKYLVLAKQETGSGGQVKITVQFTNSGIGRAFDWSEFALWARDPDDESREILLGTSYAGAAEAKHIDALLTEFNFDVFLKVDNAAAVTVTIDDSLVYATREEMTEAISKAGKVKSVNGKEGDVVLGAADVGAMPLHPDEIELNTGGKYKDNGGYIDFHFAGAKDDHTTRLIEYEKGQLNIEGNLMIGGNQTIHAGNVSYYAQMLTADVNLYVNAATGSDTTGDGTADKPFATVTKAVYAIPKNLGGHTASVVIAPGTYAEDVSIYGFYGGVIGLYPADNTNFPNLKNVKVGNCSAFVKFEGLHFLVAASSVGVGAELSGNIYVSSCTFDGQNNPNSIGVYGDINSAITVSNSSFSNFWVCLFATSNARMTFNNTGAGTGSGNEIMVYAAIGGIIGLHNVDAVEATVRHMAEAGGRIYANAQENPPSY